MKIKPLLAWVLGGASALFTQTTSAQTWQTVDDFQYIPGQDSGNAGLVVAPSGTLFAAGWGFDPSGLSHALVMASGDGGATWSAPLDDFTNGGAFYAAYNGTGCDGAGNVYAAGYYSGDGPNHWLLRRSTDGGATWSTVDDYYDGGWETAASAVAADAAGTVYVAGYSTAGSIATPHWVIRKGIGGNNFTTVDSIPCAWAVGAAAIRVHPTAGVFAAGVGPISTNKSQVTYGWVVRRSTNAGSTWATVDKFALASGQRAAAFGLGADAQGNLYAVGSADTVSGSGAKVTYAAHWVVRKSSDGGNSWSTVDNTLSSTGLGFQTAALGFAADSSGNLFVVGQNLNDWIVRENPGGTGPWQTADDFKYAWGSSAVAVAADSFGHVVVGGYGADTTGVDHWLVRKH